MEVRSRFGEYTAVWRRKADLPTELLRGLGLVSSGASLKCNERSFKSC